jgi:hypothetical protein
MGGLGGQLKKTTNRSVINVNSHLEARLSSCHNFYLRKLSSREKNHCQTEGTSSKPWPMPPSVPCDSGWVRGGWQFIGAVWNR